MDQLKLQLITAIDDGNLQVVQDTIVPYLESIPSQDKFITCAFELLKKIWGKKVEITKLIIKECLKLDEEKVLGVHFLDLAIWEGDMAAVEELIDQGVKLNNSIDEVDFLSTAVYCNHLKIVELLLKSGYDKNARVSGGYTPLIEAAFRNRVECVKLLLDNGADYTCRNYYDETPLDNASEYGNVECIKILVDRGSDINAVGGISMTALDHAAAKNKLESVKCLLSYDSVCDITKTNSLHWALKKGNEDCAEFLINNGADIRAHYNTDLSSIHLAAQSNSLKMIELLLSRGLNVNAATLNGRKPLHCAVQYSKMESVVFLLENGAKVSCSSGETCQPVIHEAAKQGNIKILQLIIDHGADVNFIHEGYSALYAALKKRNTDGAILLVNSGADVNVKTSKGKSPLYKAVKSSAFRVIQHLLENGADVKTENGENQETVLHIACERGYMKTAALLIDRGADLSATCKSGTTPMSRAFTFDKVGLIELLLDKGANIMETIDGVQLLHLAASRGSVSIVDRLLKLGANISSRDDRGYTTLHFAVESGCSKTVEFILDQDGVDIQCATKIGVTPLHLAAYKGLYQIVKRLVNRGARVDLYTYYNEGMTVLKFAVDKGCVKSVKYLIMSGSKINFLNDHRPPLFRAAARGHIEVFSILFEHGACMTSYYYSLFEHSHYYDLNKNKNCFDVTDGEFVADKIDYKEFDEFLVKVIAKMASKKLDIAECYLQEIDECSKRRKLRKNCMNEIERMKSTYVQNVSLSLFDFFTKDVNELVSFVRNEAVVEAFETTNFSVKFPLYAELIMWQFNEAIEKRDFLNEGKIKLQILFPQLLEICIDKVLSNLADKDVHNLITTFDPDY